MRRSRSGSHDSLRSSAALAVGSGLLALLVAAGTAGALLDHEYHLDAGQTGSSAADAPSAEPSDWFVDEPHGPADTLRFETREGTWMSVDVAPDGRSLVFDLLGDLYTLPIEGGEARRLTSGQAYDIQPRFSPDGRDILFTSDRGGGTNLWVMHADGSEARPITADTQHETNLGAWAADGEMVVCRKRYTDYSSLGTTELWLVDRRGGSGVELTKKDARPEVNEPVFSPDGRFIYFSNRGGRYRYNLDPLGGIYQVHRYDRRTGVFSAVTDGVGGGCRPALSPDGRTLAFVRRDRLRSVLYLHDLDTGRERPLWDGLDLDQQEGFCFNGTYPGYDFTPDGRAIVISAKGGFWRVDLAGGDPEAIPFRAEVEQIVTRALRFPRDITSTTFRSRMLSWPTIAPGGGEVVFAAVGALWSQPLEKGPNGELATRGVPRRLETEGGLAYAPAFSPDGRSLAYVSWSDGAGGAVWRMPASGGTSKRLTTVPAQYANPAFSPDGTRIACVRGDGSELRGDDLSGGATLDLVWVPASGGDVSYVLTIESRGSSRRMPRPTWSRDGDRIYYISTESTGPTDEKTSLWSVRPDGTDRQEHLKFKLADDVIPSPDGKWAAYSESFNAYLTTLPEVGREPVEITGEDGPLPAKRFTKDGGEWLGWTDGGKSVTWSYGPQVFRLPIDSLLVFWERNAARRVADREEARAKVRAAASGDTAAATPDKEEGKDKEEEKDERAGTAAMADTVAKSGAPDVHPDTLDITLELERARPTGAVAIRGGRLVTMKGDEVIEDGTLLIRDNRIAEIGPSASVKVPEGVRVLDARGTTIVPGFIDTHAHLHYNTLDVLPEQQWAEWCNLAYGVTTTHDPSASSYAVFTESEMIEAGVMKGPRCFSTGLILYGAGGGAHVQVDKLSDARDAIRRMKRLGAWSVKSYMQPRREQRQMIIQAAREESVLVVPEGGGNLESDCTHVIDGHTSNEHALPVAPIYNDVATLFGGSGTVETPTLLVAYGGLMGENWFYQHQDVWKEEKLLRFMPRGRIDARSMRRPVMASDGDWHHMAVAAGCREILERGGHVSLGAHGQLQGLGVHWELWALTHGGMSNHQALRAATWTGAWELGLDRDLGSLEAGKLADLVVMDQDPLERIENSTSVRWVVKNGEVFEADTMRQTWPLERACPRFLFQSFGPPPAATP